MGLISLLGKSKPNHSFKQKIADIIGYPPKNLVLFERVFTHRSLEKVGEDGRKINYERLEFLGDAVLGTIIGNYLFSQMPDADEGGLTQMRSKIVRREFLNHIGKSLKLYPLLKSKVDKSHHGDDVHGNIFEALVGAVFVDVGFLKCMSFVETKVIRPYVDLAAFEDRVISYKGILVNWFQQQKLTYRYDVFEDSGSNKSLMFKARLFVNNGLVASARSSNKKKAAEKVSKRAYFKFANQIRQQKQIKNKL
ncbi:MAG: ribonuclease III [Legionellales bacterium]|nr:ribonuclease III [Legionellales bacterium]